MSFITDKLQSGESIVYEASVSKLAYIGALVSLGIMMEPLSLLRTANTQLALTDKRLIGKTGALGRNVILLPHAQIGVVRVTRGLIGLLLGCGTLVVGSRDDDTRVKFKWIKHPKVLQVKINEAIELAILGRKMSAFGETPEPLLEASADIIVENIPAITGVPFVPAKKFPALMSEADSEPVTNSPPPRVDPEQW